MGFNSGFKGLMRNPTEHFPRCIHYAANAYVQLSVEYLTQLVKR